jgi:hypothetical protein
VQPFVLSSDQSCWFYNAERRVRGTTRMKLRTLFLPAVFIGTFTVSLQQLGSMHASATSSCYDEQFVRYSNGRLSGNNASNPSFRPTITLPVRTGQQRVLV